MKILRQILSPRMLVVFLMGFSSGVPLLLVGGTLKGWMRDEGVDLATIGFLSLVGLPYTLKFLWSPLLDHVPLPFLGRRRGWLIVTQILLLVLIALLGVTGMQDLKWVGILTFTIAFVSATQDIVVDAYRREILSEEELGLGSSYAVNGYRLAIWLTSGGAFLLAGLMNWTTAYLVLSLTLLIGVLTTLLAPEPERTESLHMERPSLRSAVVGPFKDYFSRPGAVLFLIFIFLYKLGDQMASEMLNPFYIDMGFAKEQIGAIAKSVGLVATLGGGFVGGVLMLKLGLTRSLWFFGILQALSTLGFSALSSIGPELWALTAVVAFENITGGMGTSAYAAFMASLTNRQFTATQYALLSSLMGVPRVFAGAATGVLAEHLGWSGYFLMCALVAIPGLFLLVKVIEPLKNSELQAFQK